MEQSITKLIRIMVVGQTQEEAEDTAKWLTGSESKNGFFNKNHKGYEFVVYCRWPNCPVGLPGAPASDALLIRIKSESQWNAVRDYVKEQSLILFKGVIGDTNIAGLAEELKPNLVASNDTRNEEIFEELIKAETTLDELLINVFKNFDKSGDGFIDVQEMKSLCRELGVDVTQADFEQTLHALDVDKDNKISFEEFANWWKKGRQCSKLMESLISMKIATSTFLNSMINSKYLDFIKEKIEKVKKEKLELTNSFFSLNLEKVSINPDVLISLDGYFGGENKDTISKSYIQNFTEGLKSTHFFLIIEFTLKDPSLIDHMHKSLTTLLNTIRESFRNISRKFFTFINNEVSIKVIRKNENVICLSFKLRKVIKEQLASWENCVKYFIDDKITQTINLSFCMSGNVDKVKESPNSTFIETFDPKASLEVKTEILKRNLKLLAKSLKPIPRHLKFWLNSYGGSHVELNFTSEHLKSSKNSLLHQPSKIIVEHLKKTFIGILQEILSSFGGYGQFKKFYEAIQNQFVVVVNTPQFYVNSVIDITGLTQLF